MDLKYLEHKHIQRGITKITIRKIEKDLVNLPIKDEHIYPNP